MMKDTVAQGGAVSFGDIGGAMRRHWLVSTAAFVLVVAVGVLTALTLPERYESESTIAAEANLSGKRSPRDPIDAVNFLLPLLAAEMESNTFAEAARAGLRGEAVDNEGDVTVSFDPDNATLTVEATSSSAEAAAAYANAWTNEMVQRPAASRLVSLRVLDVAETPSAPYTPIRSAILGGAVLLGLFAAAGAALLAAAVRRRSRRLRDALDAAGVPLLAEIPLLSRSERARARKGVTAAEVSPELDEAIHALASSVRLLGRREKVPAVAVTASRRQEGTSTVTAFLARALAGPGSPVTLIDANLRTPALRRAFSVREAAEGQLVLQQPVDGGLNLVTFGTSAQHPADVLGDLLPALLGVARDEQRFAVLDCPSLIDAAETAVAVSDSENVVLVVDARRHPESLAQELDLVESTGARLLGVVLNQVRGRPGGPGYSTDKGAEPAPRTHRQSNGRAAAPPAEHPEQAAAAPGPTSREVAPAGRRARRLDT